MRHILTLAAVLLGTASASAQAPCAGGSCPAASHFGITLPVARPSGPVCSSAPASARPGFHPLRRVLGAERRAIRTVFLRK